MPQQPPEEICTLIINGQEFRDWERVEVKADFPGKFRGFSVSISEESPTPATMGAQQIKPGDKVDVILAGEKAAEGYVYERQTVMDATTHAVQISGQSKAQDLVLSNVDVKILSGKGQFQNKSLVEIAQEVLKPYGLSIEKKTGDQEGMNAKFKDAQVTRGETTFQFLERLCRPCAVHIGDTTSGNLHFHGVDGGGGGGGGTAALVEGENIQSMRLVVSDERFANVHAVMGQGAADNTSWGGETAQRELRVAGEATRYKPNIFQLERGFSNNSVEAEFRKRIAYEKVWREGTKIQGEVTVYGWIKPGGGLWQLGPESAVYVNAPSAMVTQTLHVRELTFSQDSQRGTLTTLGLVVKEFYYSK